MNANPFAACGAANTSGLLAVPSSVLALSEQLAATSSAMQRLRSSTAPLAFAPLARSLAGVATRLDGVTEKRRRVICKLGRRAASHSSALSALEVLSLETFERLLDGLLTGEQLPEAFRARLELLGLLRTHGAAIDRKAREARFERRQPPSRRPRLEPRSRTPNTARTASRPVGSLAPPERLSPLPVRSNPPRGAPVT